MADAKPASGIISVKNKSTLVLPPGIQQFANWVKPDEYEGKLRFDVQTAWNPGQVTRAAELLQKHAVDEVWEEMLAALDKREAELKAAGKKSIKPKEGWVKPDAADWLEDHLKPPSERSKVQHPTLKIANDAEYKDRKTGQLQRKTMKAYDLKGVLLDLPKLKLGMGSLIQPIVMAGLFISPLIKQPSLSLKLQGARVLQVVQYGAGGGSNLEEISEEDLALLGDDFQASDLSAYAGGGSSAPEEDSPRGRPQTTGASDYGDDDDEVPF